MQNETVCQVADGYYICEKRKVVDMDTAWKMLHGKHKHRYTSATRCENNVMLTQHVLHCPNCGCELPSYRRFVEPIAYWRRGEETKIDEDTLEELTDRQMMLFEESRKTSMQLNCVVEPIRHTCRNCGYQSEKAKEMREVHIEGQDQKITVSSELNDLTQVLELPFQGKTDVSIMFPITEKIVFDLKKGCVTLEMWDHYHKKISCQDIGLQPEKWKHRQSIHFIETYSFLMDKVVEKFQFQWIKDTFPYSKEECSFAKLCLVTRYPGFEKEFYCGIPLSKGKNVVDESFQEVMKEIHGEQSIQKMFETSSLPQIKSVKKYFYQNPSLCFYIKELEMLWRVLQDPNLLMQMLKLDIFRTLTLIREYPNTEVFFVDYARIRGAILLVAQFEDDMTDIMFYAVGYSAMSAECRKKEQAKWSVPDLQWKLRAEYSRPYQTLDHIEEDCKINGYVFHLLRSSNEYQEAGKALQNCLNFNWDSGSNHGVFVVMKNREYKAAIEIRERVVLQARLKKNASLRYNPSLEKAYYKWIQRFHLREGYDDDDLYLVDDDDELPFN